MGEGTECRLRVAASRHQLPTWEGRAEKPKAPKLEPGRELCRCGPVLCFPLPLPRDSPELSPLPLRTHSAAAAPLREASCSPISRTLSAHGSSPSHLPCDLGQDAASSSVVGSPVHHISSPLANVPDGSVDDGGLLRLFSRLFPAFLSQPSHQPCKRHTVPRYLLLPG